MKVSIDPLVFKADVCNGFDVITQRQPQVSHIWADNCYYSSFYVVLFV